ncbi:DNA repair and recombination protein RadB [Candidatus Pacearchaeota archaeon RBG_16_35_8]|nr:MAG: DNA repair and recombination protein RadB [Candidatus Pacearchaeota archaeon RBG_16_35_8]
MGDYKTEKISTGSFDLNKWLYGGYEKGIITMIAGPPGSGKTNFCILVSCSQVKKDNKIIYIDTEGGFSPERVKQMVGEGYEKVLENILLIKPVDFEEQKKYFLKLLETIKKEKIGLIIIDGMAMHYRLELGDAIELKNDGRIKDVNRDLARQMKILSEISRRHDIPVIITNQVYSGFLSKEEMEKGVEKTVNLVGGDLMKYWSKCIVELRNDGNRKKAILLKHRSLPVKEINFEIRNEGIFKRGWL